MNILPPERVQAIFASLDAGQSISATARSTGATRRTVARYRQQWLRVRRPHGVETSADRNMLIAVKVGTRVAQRLDWEAKQRGLSRHELAAALISEVLADELIAVVLGEDPRVQALLEQLAGAIQ